MIARYAMAKGEEEGDPLPVTTWFTLDAPHQGANLTPAVLDFFKSIPGDFLHKAYDNDAAKIMLNYNPFDLTGAV